MTFGLETAQTIGRMRYSRQNEQEADREGMSMLLNAGIDPTGMITFFEKLQKNEMNMPGVMQYFSSHPATGNRINELKKLARKFPKSAEPLLPNHDWENFRRICEKKPELPAS